MGLQNLVDSFGATLKPEPDEPEASMPRPSWLERQQRRRRHLRSDRDDSYDPDGDESYSDEYVSALRTAMDIWEQESRRDGRRLSQKSAHRGFLLLGSADKRSWKRSTKQPQKMFGRVPAQWIENPQEAPESPPDARRAPPALQWQLQ